ncbi:hypothetical protein C2G38_316266 [Gigaspora rosea]|uniref:Uncharacterized protein n=1 Tax=Gigaspora rosea TaxID=44941 RepID=A0A397UIB6_9GLOM|nr:hypothetical protein C2G38_316266 [Gigaspora rosea]
MHQMCKLQLYERCLNITFPISKFFTNVVCLLMVSHRLIDVGLLFIINVFFVKIEYICNCLFKSKTKV